MIKYIAGRLVMMIPTLLGVSVIVFLFIRLIPGDTVRILAGARGDITPEQYANLRHSLGLDRPLLVQYTDWLGKVARGDLGASLKTGRAIGPDIVSRFPATLELALLAAAIGIAIAIPAGVVAARKRGSRTELAAQGVALAGLSVPDFWLGTMLLLLASRFFGWYPGSQYVSIFDDPLKNLSIFILPAISVGVGLSASLMRITRSALIEAMGAPYVVTARAKGLNERAVLYRHALRNALIPIVTILGLQMAYLLGGVVIVETVFNLPGLGRFTVDAISARDYPVVQGAVLVVTLIVLVINLLVDLLYAAIDPRISYAGDGS